MPFFFFFFRLVYLRYCICKEVAKPFGTSRSPLVFVFIPTLLQQCHLLLLVPLP